VWRHWRSWRPLQLVLLLTRSHLPNESSLLSRTIQWISSLQDLSPRPRIRKPRRSRCMERANSHHSSVRLLSKAGKSSSPCKNHLLLRDLLRRKQLFRLRMLTKLALLASWKCCRRVATIPPLRHRNSQNAEHPCILEDQTSRLWQHTRPTIPRLAADFSVVRMPLIKNTICDQRATIKILRPCCASWKRALGLEDRSKPSSVNKASPRWCLNTDRLNPDLHQSSQATPDNNRVSTRMKFF
jgi:hypothetical protein